MNRVSIDKDLLDLLVASVQPLPDNVPEAISAPELPIDRLPEPAIVALAPIPENANKQAPLMAWGSKVSSTFRARIWWMACMFRMDPNWIMACIAWESGESFSPSKKNMAGSGAVGLIQFMPDTAKELGTTTAKLAAMTAEDQINWVYRYFKLMIERHGPLTTIEDTYMAILWPAAIGKPVASALWDKATRPTTYRQNAGLDSNKDGTITKFEAASHVRDKLTKGLRLAA